MIGMFLKGEFGVKITKKDIVFKKDIICVKTPNGEEFEIYTFFPKKSNCDNTWYLLLQGNGVVYQMQMPSYFLKRKMYRLYSE